MAKAKEKPKTKAFKGLYLPAALLAESRISLAEKIILADIRYFNGTYNFSYPAQSKKFHISRSTAIRAIERLGGKLELIESTGNTRNRCLKLTEKAEKLFSEVPTPKMLEKSKPFVKPTALQVVEYAASIDFEIDGQRFIDWYEERDWKAGKNKMKDWRTAVRTWKSRSKDNVRTDTVSQSVGAEPFIR